MPKLASMQWLRIIPVLALSASLFAACQDNSKKPTDTLSSGKIDVSIDETYRPIIEEQLKVFDSSFPEAKVIPHYKPESQCFDDLVNEKVRVILVTRDLTKEEKGVYESRKLVPTSLAIARDAVAVILNSGATDTLLSMSQIKGILTGQYSAKKYKVVFDNQGSSTLRFITDSILRGEKLGPNVYAAKGNDSVVDYVSRNPDAIGFVGLSYVSEQTDVTTGAFKANVKVAALQNDSTLEFYQPYQAYIALKRYPLTRDLYFIRTETYPGLATGFTNFLSRERGQLIFQHAQLFPLRMNVVIREAAISNKPPGQ